MPSNGRSQPFTTEKGHSFAKLWTALRGLHSRDIAWCADLLIGMTLGVQVRFATSPRRCHGKELGEVRVPSHRSIRGSRVWSPHRRTRYRYRDRRTRTSRRL